MVANYGIGLAVILLVVYMIGVANREWTSPLDIARRWWPDDENRRSEDVDTESVHVQSTVHPVVIRRPEMIDLGGDDDEEPPEVDPEERKEWVRARMRPGDPLKLTKMGIDKQGADLFDCSEKTIRRIRAEIAKERHR